MAERTLVINGFSKTYAMTGWRIGYALAPQAILQGMLKVQQHSVSCAASFMQYAALAALQASQDCVTEMVAEFSQRRQVIVKRLTALGLRCVNPEGAFYAFVHAPRDSDDLAFTEQLLTETQIVGTPGSAFGSAGRGYVRFSFAASMADIVEAMDRIAKVV